MTIRKEQDVDQIEVVENGTVQVRTRTIIFENDVEISKTFHRHTVAPGDDYGSETSLVRDICEKAHTVETIEKYRQSQISID